MRIGGPGLGVRGAVLVVAVLLGASLTTAWASTIGSAASTATPISVGQTVHGRIDFDNGDFDTNLYSFQAVGGRVYYFATNHTGAALAPNQLSVYEPNTWALLEYGASHEGHAWVTFVAPVDGTYTLQVYGWTAGEYDLTMTDSGPASVIGRVEAITDHPAGETLVRPWGSWIGERCGVAALRDTGSGLAQVGITWADSWGRFAFASLPDGDYVFSFWRTAHYDEATSTPVAVVSGSTAQATVLARILPPSITGNVSDIVSGGPVNTAVLKAYRRDEQEGSYWWRDSIRVGSDGVYSLWLWDGDYKLEWDEWGWAKRSAWWPDATKDAAAVLAVHRGSTIQADLELAPAESIIDYGEAVTLTSKLGEPEDTELSGLTAVVERWDAGLQRWLKVGDAPSTSTTGRFALTVKTYRRTPYRMRVPSGAIAPVSTSRVLLPKPYVSNPIACSTMSPTKYYRVYGWLKPKHDAYTYPVRIYKWRLVNGKWKSYGFDIARAYDYDKYTKYWVKVRLPYKGKWMLRAYAPRDSLHAATWSSGYDHVIVR